MLWPSMSLSRDGIEKSTESFMHVEEVHINLRIRLYHHSKARQAGR